MDIRPTLPDYERLIQQNEMAAEQLKAIVLHRMYIEERTKREAAEAALSSEKSVNGVISDPVLAEASP